MLTVPLLKEDKVTAVSQAELFELKLTLYERSTEGILNSRAAQSIKNANGGVYGTTGPLVLTLAPADMVCLLTRESEWHVALLEYSWAAGASKGKAEIVFQVANLRLVS